MLKRIQEMFSELYTAASGMVVRQAQMDVLAHNLSNTNTVAFKTEEMASEERPLDTGRLGVSQAGGVQRSLDLRPGPVQPTGESLDLALVGEGFFLVQAQDGIRLTRDGRFSISQDGRLVFMGMPVLGEGGEIYVGDEPFQVANDGRISRGETEIGRLRVVTVTSPQELEREGHGLFRVSREETVKGVEGPAILQGYLETSNADPIRIMVQIIEALRAFEAQQQVIQTVDRLGEKAIREIARV
ncbi:MAG: flagellar hook-basal body protein [Thermodesulfobacteriota bacterium]